MFDTILVTGGAGFIGSTVVKYLLKSTPYRIVNVDKLTYAANLDALEGASQDERYTFVRGDICDGSAMAGLLAKHKPWAIMHLAAESHVDRSIDGAADFIQTNIVGTYALLEAALGYWRDLDDDAKQAFRFHHVSTDEVYGSLGPTGLFTEETPYRPNSPYSASKASSDHLVRAWHHTFGLPVVISNCSNNYGPYQFPEKLIPVMILNALTGKTLPVYGDGTNVRDWLHVEDHADALWTVLSKGVPGEVYNIGGHNEMKNIDVVRLICQHVDAMADPLADGEKRESLIRFVTDRPGHDARYAIDASKIERELGWKPKETFETGLAATVRWYLDHRPWWEGIRQQRYAGQRLGLGASSPSAPV